MVLQLGRAIWVNVRSNVSFIVLLTWNTGFFSSKRRRGCEVANGSCDAWQPQGFRRRTGSSPMAAPSSKTCICHAGGCGRNQDGVIAALMRGIEWRPYGSRDTLLWNYSKGK